MWTEAELHRRPLECESSVLLTELPAQIGVPRIELGSRPPEGRILPLYDTPLLRIYSTQLLMRRVTDSIVNAPAPLAQLVRACDSHSQGPRFDPWKVHL